MSWLRTLAAFLIAPLITPIVLAFNLFGRVPGVRELLFCVYLFGPFAYGAAILFGIPALLLFRSLNWTNPLLFFGFGALIGLVVAMFMVKDVPIEYVISHKFRDLTISAFAAGSSAIAFRFIALGFRDATYRLSMRGET